MPLFYRMGEVMAQDTRREPRFPFIAAAEVLAEGTGSRMSTRISDLSASGCYVDTINPLPGGTFVQLKIFSDSQTFEAAARVVYAHAHLGMGLAFREVQPNFRSVLQNWLPAAV
jgi:hypothetical protein